MAKKDEIYEDEDYEEEEEETEEEEDVSVADLIRQEIKDLIKERSKYAKTSEEYMVLTQRITDATEQLRDAETADNESAQKQCAIRNKNAALYQTLGTVFGTIAGNTVVSLINAKNVNKVIDYERSGEIVRSAATKFIK